MVEFSHSTIPLCQNRCKYCARNSARLTKEIAGGDVSLKGARMAPQTIFSGKVGPHRVFDGTVFQLSDIRAIKDRVPGATVNDVILAVIGGALREYLISHDNLPKTSMTAMAPISVRAEGEKEALGNLVSAMTVQLGTHIADPAERLHYIHKEVKNSKAMTNAVGARTLTDYSQFLPAALAGLGARLYTRLGVSNIHSPVFNCVATNVPGPRVPLYFAGAKLVRMMGLGPIFDGMGLINTIYSYGPEIAISFTSDRAIMPDPANYAAALQRSFDALMAADMDKPVVKAKDVTAKAKEPKKDKPKTKAKPKAAKGS
jgi:diacylglycerol O-acyltransferase / wax synthase